MKSQIIMSTPIGDIQITGFSPNDEVNEIYIDLISNGKETSVACITVEENPDTDKIDFCSRLFFDGSEDYSCKTWHNIPVRIKE